MKMVNVDDPQLAMLMMKIANDEEPHHAMLIMKSANDDDPHPEITKRAAIKRYLKSISI